MTGDPQTPGPEAERPYAVICSRQAVRNLHENLPLNVAAAATGTIDGPLAPIPHRVGNHLMNPSTASTPRGAGPTGSSTASTRTSTPWKSTLSGTDGTPSGTAPETR